MLASKHNFSRSVRMLL